MEKDYIIYEKNGYTYIHYNGCPQGIRIEKNEKVYDYDWGWLKVGKKDHTYYDFHGKTDEMCQSILKGTISMQEGLYGAIDKNGKELLPYIFDQIEILRDSVFVRMGNSYWELDFNSCSAMSGDYSATGFFVKKGKKGWQVDGKEVIPALYDYIYHSHGSNYYEVQLNGEYKYIDEHMNPVLTNVRHCTDTVMPTFPLRVNEKNVIIMREYVGQKNDDNNNVVMLNSNWVCLDRVTCEELMDMLINEDDEQPMTLNDLELFNNDFSYEYAVHMVKSTGGIRECWQKMLDMNVDSNSWHYIVKVWCAKGEHPEASDLRFLKEEIEMHKQLGQLHFAFGHDDKLSAGETKMLIVTHYNERCWPADFEFAWNANIDTCSLKELKKELEKLEKEINDRVFPEYRQQVLQEQFDEAITGMRCDYNRKWSETVKILDWLNEKDKTYKRSSVYYITQSYVNSFMFWDKKSKVECDFRFKKLKWVLEQGANCNYHKHGKTALDLIRDGMKCYENIISKKEQGYLTSMQQRCERLLLSFGAKTMVELKNDQAMNTDYKQELKRMSH